MTIDELDNIPYLISDDETGDEETENRLYTKNFGKKIVQTAKLKLLGIGKWAFETSLFGEKPFETNMNMPLFNTEKEAYAWIDQQPKWLLKKRGEHE